MTAAAGSVLDGLAEELDDLHEDVGVPVTARRRWGQRWAEAHPGWRPWVVLVRDDRGRMTGAALLARRVTAWGMVDVVGLGHRWADHAALPARDPDAAGALGDALVAALTALPGPWRLRVEQLPDGDPVAGRVAEQLPVSRLLPGDPCPTVTLRTPDGQARVHGSKDYRYQVRRSLRNLTAAGQDHALEFTDEPAAVRARLADVVALRTARDHAFGRASDLDSPSGRWLFATLCDDLLAAGQLELATMTIDGDLAAYDLLISDGTVVRNWDGRIDSRFGRVHPGQVLQHALLQELSRRPGLERCDLMRGDGLHKRRVADVAGETVDLHAWSSHPVRVATSAPSATRQRLREQVQGHPEVLRTWRTAKRVVLRRT